MREVMADVERWLDQKEKVALATVVETWGSAPRGVGAKMALTPAGQIAGSVSGGCVEGAVFEAGVEVLETQKPQLLSFGVADETAWDVGLACGGQIRVFVEPLEISTQETVNHWLREETAGASVVIIDGPQKLLGAKLLIDADGTASHNFPPQLQAAALSAGQQALSSQAPQIRTLEGDEEVTVFIDVLLPPPTLVMVGGVHIAVALTSIARSVGYRTIVVDPRRAFGSEERFPHVDRLIQAWPDKAFAEIRLNSSTAVAMLTHDPKIDDPALKAVLPSPAFYVGALGSSTTHQKRRRRLLENGLAPELVDRIHSPIGLDIAAATPEEIALSVMAEVIAARRKATILREPQPVS